EVKSVIQTLQNSQDHMESRITETEQRISKIEDDRGTESQRIQQLEQRITAAAECIDDLENRSRCNNVRIIRLPEGVEEGNPIAFLQKTLPGLLGLESGMYLEMERAHRVLGPHPAQGQHPRAFIIKLLRYLTRDHLLRATRLKDQVMWQEHRISFYPDLSRDLQMNRQKILQNRKIKYGMFYPAILKITINGETT
uniref:L1 transposable element RRM domain-containing protein n=1 Tax=Latimeria chalumnae TaxID=7897 RepID=H3AP03_LATCH